MEYTVLQPIPNNSTSNTSSLFDVTGNQLYQTTLYSTNSVTFDYTASMYIDASLINTEERRWSVNAYDSSSTDYQIINTNLYTSYSIQYEINNAPIITPAGIIDTSSLVEWYNPIHSSASWDVDYATNPDRLILSSSVANSISPLIILGSGSARNPYPMDSIYYTDIEFNKFDQDLTDVTGDKGFCTLPNPSGSIYNFDEGITIETWVQFISGSDTLPNKNQLIGISNDSDPNSQRNNSNCFIERNSTGTQVYANLMNVDITGPVTEQITPAVNINNNQWYHLALTYQYTSNGPGNQYDLKLYMNGAETSSLANATLGWPNFIGTYGNYAPVFKVAQDYDNKRTQPCRIGQMRIYNVPVSASVILNNYNAESNIY